MKTTSSVQTNLVGAERKTVGFSLPSVLTLDSYTQTNESDRLSTTLIEVRKQKSEAQTGTDDRGVHVNTDIPIRNSHIPNSSKPSTSGVESGQSTSFDDPSFFAPSNKCRHGNERQTCHSCAISVVQKKYSKPVQERPTPAPKSQSPAPKSQSPALKTRTPRVESIAAVKPEDEDSGQESDIDPLVVSNTKLMKIKNLAKAKLKQIKHGRRDSHSLERPATIDPSDWSDRRPPPRIGRDGVASFTLDSLPRLNEKATYYAERTTEKVNQLLEEKRLGDVTRAKQFIQHCIDTPVTPEKYTHRSRRSYESPLPRVKHHRRCESEATNVKRNRGIADDVESRKCVSEVPSGKMRRFDVNYKAYINALERIVDSNLDSLVQAESVDKRYRYK